MSTTVEEKAKARAEELRAGALPEARASVNYSLTSPKGFSCQLTIRSTDEGEIFELMESTELFLTNKGYTPEVRRSFNGGAKPKEYVEGKKCPKCGSKLVRVVYKDKTTGEDKVMYKCETNKWDFATKTASGCDYKEFPESTDPATPAQMALLQEKNLWEDGMTKSKATELIGQVLGKN